jgi:hypothetical protein
MMTVDNLLLKIVNFTEPTIEETMAPRDSKVLRSLATSIASNFFITENQGRLLIKILRENSKKLPNFSEEISTTTSAPIWSKSFRHIEQVKKFYIKKNEEHESVLFIELTYSQEIRKILQNLSKTVEGLVASLAGKTWTAELTEKNIVALYEAFEPHDFDIDETIKNHYATIKSWSETEFRNQFIISNIEHKNFLRHITDDLGIETPIDQNIINDRSMRYQYFTENAKNHGETLVEVIANRSKPRVWVDKEQHDLAEVVASLINLHRLPLLVVFDTIVNAQYLTNLQILSDALEKNSISNDVGVYFRLPNDPMGKQFNSIIAEKQYNHRLDNDLKVAVVMSGKIPKFFLNNSWKPMSVIALDTKMGLRHGKTSIYSNCCDCIIEWSNADPMFDKKVILK